MRSRPHPGFTLIEVLIVVVILGILAAITVPQIASAAAGSEQAVFAANIKAFVRAAQRYELRTGMYLEDSSSGEMPSGFDDYIDADAWVAGTPLGGVWDAELNQHGIVSGLGVHFNDGSDPGPAAMTEIDQMIDDGDLTTGGFRQIAADRYYWIIAD